MKKSREITVEDTDKCIFKRNKGAEYCDCANIFSNFQCPTCPNMKKLSKNEEDSK